MELQRHFAHLSIRATGKLHRRRRSASDWKQCQRVEELPPPRRAIFDSRAQQKQQIRRLGGKRQTARALPLLPLTINRMIRPKFMVG